MLGGLGSGDPCWLLRGLGCCVFDRSLERGEAVRSVRRVFPYCSRASHGSGLSDCGRYRDCRVTVDLALEVPVDARDRAVDTLMATAAVAWRL